MKIIFLGTPIFVQCIKEELANYFTLVDSLEEADLGVIAAYGKILSQEELDSPKFGCINVHPSLLPKYRGASPIQEAILHGDATTGLTIIKIDAEVDHGSILYQKEIQLSETETFDSFAKSVFAKAAEILPDLIKDYLEGKITLQEQNHTQATFCTRLTRESGYFDINTPPDPETLDRMIRAYHPWPGVWTKWNGKIVKFLPSSHPRPDRGSINNDSLLDSRLPPKGTSFFEAARGNDKFLIQIEGKKPVSKKDFLNGYSDFPLK